MILHSELSQDNQFFYTITPIYIDDYIPKPAKGELGNYILNYIAHKSKLLDTYVHVNEHLNTAFVINDSINMARHVLDYYLEDLEWQQANYYFVSKPIAIPEAGSLSHICLL